MNISTTITDAEWLVMRALWEAGDGAVSQIAKAVRHERDISIQTVKTLLRRLIDKGLVGYEVDKDDPRAYRYRPLISEGEAVRQRSEDFLSRIHRENAGDFLAHFVENAGLSKEELLRLRNTVEKKLGDGQG